MPQSDYVIQLFAKAPVLGHVKTRLQPVLTTEQSLQLHQALVLHTFEKLYKKASSHLQIWAASEPEHAFFETMRRQHNVPIIQQRGKDLGERMANAVECALQEFNGVIIIGTDCPFMTEDYVQTARQMLDGEADVVLGPAHDGGYVLIGMKTIAPALFADIPWGGDQVLARTVERIQASGLCHQLLPVQCDIDRPDDLLLLDNSCFPPDLRKFSQFAPG